MRRLILMRHAKSSWDDPDQDDRDRPLNDRGRLASALMGAWLAESGHVPDHVLLSPAVRAAETWERAAAAAGASPVRDTVRQLYMGDAAAHLRALRNSAPKGAETVLMVGHQPGFGAFLRRMSARGVRPGPARAFEKFPTGAVAVLELDGEWEDAEFGAARFTAFVTPKDLV